MRARSSVIAVVAILAGCSNGGIGSGAAVRPEQGVLAVQARGAAPGAEAQVQLKVLPGAGPIVTIVSELNYDPTRLTMQRCSIDPTIGAGTAAGKSLHVAEPTPGVIRTVVEGGLAALPAESGVLHCAFTVAPQAGAGPTAVRVHGEVADTTFEDRAFSAEGTVVIGN
ncbi:MAG: hypothetical protein ACE5I7_17140 [Candidatus Binatia bacterium]